MKKLLLAMLTLVTMSSFSETKIACVEIKDRPRPNGVVIKNKNVYYADKKIEKIFKNPKVLKKKYELENLYTENDVLKLRKSSQDGYKNPHDEYFIDGKDVYYRSYKLENMNYSKIEIFGQIKYTTTGKCNTYTHYADILRLDDLYMINGNVYATLNKYILEVYENEAVEYLYILAGDDLTEYDFGIKNYFYEDRVSLNRYKYDSRMNQYNTSSQKTILMKKE